jgi:hypothetical protein
MKCETMAEIKCLPIQLTHAYIELTFPPCAYELFLHIIVWKMTFSAIEKLAILCYIFHGFKIG